jgi:hypothetical protein
MFENFNSYAEAGKSTKIGVDTCANGLTAKEKDSDKPIRYFTRNFYDNPNELPERGIFFTSNHMAPGDLSRQNNELLFSKNTGMNVKFSGQAFPLLTTGARHSGRGDTDDQDKFLKSNFIREKKPCLNVDTEFYSRHFTIFNGLPYIPNSNVDNVVQKNNGHRQGIDTRKSLVYGMIKDCDKKCD